MSSESSLQRLFNSQVFTFEMLLEYLSKSQNKSVLSFLTDKLLTCPTEQKEFYIPQLLNLTFYKDGCENIQTSLLQSSANCHIFALSLHSHLSSFLGSCQAELKSKVTDFIESLDMVIVNSKLPKQQSPSLPPYFYNLPSSETEIEIFNRKNIRSKYYSYQLQVIGLLCKISVGLNQVQLEDRNSKLRIWLGSVNKTIKSTRDSNMENFDSVKKLFRGPVIGMKFFTDSDEGVGQMVRIIPEQSLCYCTKSRVPYKLVYETIDVHELEQSMENSSLSSLNDEVIEDLTRVDIEKIQKLMEKKLEGSGDSNENDKYVKSRKGSEDLTPCPLVDIWGESWDSLRERIRESSPFGNFKSWKLRAVIIKGLDDLRQEYLAMQLIQKIQKIWESAHLSLYLKPYEIKVISDYMGIIEYLPNTLSIHSIKRLYPNFTTLSEFFENTWKTCFEEAQRNFVRSMAGYSIVCYLLSIKDRHNANILIDSQGHLIHIDFGFFLTTSPGGNIGFESAPFKLSQEMIDLMGGIESELFRYYKILLLQGYLELRKHSNELIVALEAMGKYSGLSCLTDFDLALNGFKERMQLNLTDEKCLLHIEALVYESQNNWRTLKYDDFQYLTNGIL